MQTQISVNHMSVALLGTLLLLAGCASRGYVRQEVGASADVLSGQIEEARGDITEAREGIAELQSQTETHAKRLDQTEESLDTTREWLDQVHVQITRVDALASEASSTAITAMARTDTLSQIVRDRNRYEGLTDHQVHFGFDSVALGAEQGAALQSVSQELQANPDAIVVLEGRTDSTGDDLYNFRLGEQRMEAVRQYLVTELAVPMYKIYGVSYGEAHSLHDNATVEQRQMNRVVNIRVLIPVSETTSVTVLQE